MSVRSLNEGWTFSLNGGEGYPVELPYDFSVIQERTPSSRGRGDNGWYPGGTGIYRRKFSLENEEAKRVYLQLEGSYGFTEVYLNGNLLSQHPHGYTEFFVDLTPCLKAGENALEVRVMNDLMPNSRWYSGSGLYRRVWLHEKPAAHILPWGVAVKTQGNRVSFQVDTEGADAVSVKLFDGDKLLCKRTFKAGTSAQWELSEVKRWTAETPYLYRAEVSALKEGVVTDTEEVRFGFRDISLDPGRGLVINGKSVRLRGACVHHDNGILGANAYTEAEWRKVRLLKAQGFNAVRLAHDPFSRDFLDACDTLGLYVIEEAFDMWRMPKNAYDYHLFFEKYWKEDARAMILRDRNRPSVIMWSDGNEIGERGGKSDGVRLAKEVASYFRSLDSRPVTNAMCPVSDGGEPDPEFMALLQRAMAGEIKSFSDIPERFREAFMGLRNGGNFNEKTKAFAEPLDVVGYNYLDNAYDEMAVKFPSRMAMTTEAFSEEMYSDAAIEGKYPQIVGNFVWTAIDYIGEAGIGRVVYSEEGGRVGDNSGFEKAAFPYFLASCGELSLTGRMLGAGACRRVMYGDKQPSLWVLPPDKTGLKMARSKWSWPSVVRSWTFSGARGKKVLIEVYSDAEEVELLVNGTPVGRCAPKDGIARFGTAYERGRIEAVNYRGGKAAERDKLKTAGAFHELRAEREAAASPCPDVDFYRITARDEEGDLVPCAREVEVLSEGFLACGSDDPETLHNFTSPRFALFEGCGLVAVKHGASLLVKLTEA